MMKTQTLTLLTIFFLALPLYAQNSEYVKEDSSGSFYIGVQTGLSTAQANFSSFGADKFRPGWNGGIHAGYIYSDLLSFEFSAKWGRQVMTVQDCCFERNYFLGEDFNRYKVVPEGMKGHYYNDLKSNTFLQRYAIQANVNVFSLVPSLKNTPWQLNLSPALSVNGSKSDILTLSDELAVRENVKKWHVGVGGNVEVAYALNDQYKLGLYGGYTYLSGKPIDGMPELHTISFVYDLGVKFSVNIGKKEKIVSRIKSFPSFHKESSKVAEQPSNESRIVAEPVQPSVQAGAGAESYQFPVIYFSFNKANIEPDEVEKVLQIADIMKKNESIRICIIGWADEVGSEKANEEISLKRAKAVKQMLLRLNVPDNRMEVLGGSIDHKAPTHAEARNVTIIIIDK